MAITAFAGTGISSARQSADLDHDAAAPRRRRWRLRRLRLCTENFKRDIERARRSLGLQRIFAAGDVTTWLAPSFVANASGAAAISTTVVSAIPARCAASMVEQADGTGAEQHRALGRNVTSAGDRMQEHRERLGERRCLIRHVVGNFHALRRDGVEVGRKATLHMRGLRGRSHEEDVLARDWAGSRGKACSGRTSATD